MALDIGEKYLTISIGDVKIPAFPSKDKEGRTFYKADIRIFVNEKRQPKAEKIPTTPSPL